MGILDGKASVVERASEHICWGSRPELRVMVISRERDD